MINNFFRPAVVLNGHGSYAEIHHTTVTITESELDRAANQLADAVGGYWHAEADSRGLLKSQVPVHWQVSRHRLTTRVAAAMAERGPRRFPPLPGVAPVTERSLRAGGDLTDLHRVYGGLASGRLMIVGPAAAGKTSAAVVLLRAALHHRADPARAPYKSGIPVPVLVTLDGWAPDAERRDVVDWAVERLSRMHKGHRYLRQLLDTGRIALFLDGFDEVGEEVRALAVAALESAPFRVVLISRTEEAAVTAERELPAGAVALELKPVRPADAAEYLLNSLDDPAPAPWQELVRQLLEEPDSAVARALADPLTVSLLAEVYAPRGPVEELFGLAGPDAVRDHLLDHAVAAAYTRKPRPPGCRPYSPETAERTLRHLAARLTEEDTTGLRWWRIPSWPGRRSRAWITGTAVTVVYLAVVVLALAPWIGPLWAAGAALTGWTLGTLDACIRLSRLHQEQRLTSAGWRDVLPLPAITGGLFDWITVTGLTWLVLRFAGHPQGLLQCCMLGLPYGFGGVLLRGRAADLVARTIVAPLPLARFARDMIPELETETRVLGPRDVWRHHTRMLIPLGLLAGGAVGLFAGGLAAMSNGAGLGLALGVAIGSGHALMAGVLSNAAVATALTAVQLSVREGTPLRLMAFLDDAHRRGLLRASGPAYEFRHVRLQERLARRP
ncbi:hypothetical protein ABT040_29040 [Streptomyces sp. NPDC002688]|uniref:hypothetical protein n=1 Tax=Streptomyces sp. NPDC002688 TaxID=3154423 RepID=UPI00331D731A